VFFPCAFFDFSQTQKLDGRVKPGHDGIEYKKLRFTTLAGFVTKNGTTLGGECDAPKSIRSTPGKIAQNYAWLFVGSSRDKRNGLQFIVGVTSSVYVKTTAS
jgi:hypothetical protein